MLLKDASLVETLDEIRTSYKCLRRGRKYLAQHELIQEGGEEWQYIEVMLDYYLNLEQKVMDAIMHGLDNG